MTIFNVLLVLTILMIVSLILPIIIVIKWRRRPVWAMLTAAAIYVLPVLIVSIQSIIDGNQNQTGQALYVSFMLAMIIWLIIGLVVLLPIQWKSRKSRKRILRDSIDEAF